MKTHRNEISHNTMKKIIALAAACAFLCTACHNGAESGHDHDHDHAHDHGHGIEPVYVILYSPSYEIYAESHPLIAGEEVQMKVHLSSIPDFRPVEGASLSAVLKTADGEVSATAEADRTGGIYTLPLAPAKDGEAELSFKIGDETVSTPVTVFHCEHDALEAQEDHEGEFEAGPNRVVFSKEQSWKVDFATEMCRTENIGQVISAAAQVLPSQNGTHSIIAKAPGIVTIAGGSLLPGTPAHKGKAVLYIGSRGLADANMDVRYNEAKSEYERALGEYERKSKLVESRIVSQSELGQAKAEYETAKAVFENLESNYSDGRFSAVPDIDGSISEVFVSNGEYVEVGQVLATVTNSSRLIVEAKVQPKWHKALANIKGANFRFYSDDRTWTLEELGGRVLSVGQATLSGSPLLPVCFEIPNKAGAMPGTFADVWIKTAGSGERVSVAKEAIVEEMGSYFVYKQITPEIFEKTQVSIGATDGIRTEILSGLSDGERVVCRGAVIVKLAQAAGGLDPHAGHNH